VESFCYPFIIRLQIATFVRKLVFSKFSKDKWGGTPSFIQKFDRVFSKV